MYLRFKYLRLKYPRFKYHKQNDRSEFFGLAPMLYKLEHLWLTSKTFFIELWKTLKISD